MFRRWKSPTASGSTVQTLATSLENLGAGSLVASGDHEAMHAVSADLELHASPGLGKWLIDERISLAFTTYQAGKLFLVGTHDDSRLSVFERTFNRCMGLWSDGQTLWMSSLYQLWRFENAAQPGQDADGYDRVYLPQVGFVTGDLDIHDVVVEDQGRVVFANTLFSCLATTSETHSFSPLWRPPFISEELPEDRCHLNGVALRDGRVRYISCISRTDVIEGWREQRRTGGCVLDVSSETPIVEGLSMPHSPRFRDDHLWLLESGSGYLGHVDPSGGEFERVAFCPGYLRGMAFQGRFAVVGLSKPRENRTFSGLDLDRNLKEHSADPRCGLAIIDLEERRIAHWLWIEGIVRELYDVVVLPGVRRPRVVGFKTDEIELTLHLDRS